MFKRKEAGIEMIYYSYIIKTNVSMAFVKACLLILFRAINYVYKFHIFA